MKYLLIVAGNTEHSAGGEAAPENLAVMQRELPRWIEDMDSRGLRLFGRELDLPATASIVRVRDGETLVTDGPYAETKEFMAGFDLLECSDLDEAIEVATTSPVSWFHTLEIRPFKDGLQLGEKMSAFGRGEDGDAIPYLLTTWMGGDPAAPFDDEAVTAETEAWRRDLEARGSHVLGSPLADADAATTVRVTDGETLLRDGPFTDTEEFIAGIDVVYCADRQEAIALAATQPIARYHAIEVRPFYKE
jgi:hypothetical protein